MNRNEATAIAEAIKGIATETKVITDAIGVMPASDGDLKAKILTQLNEIAKANTALCKILYAAVPEITVVADDFLKKS
jgi:hypothetical protein